MNDAIQVLNYFLIYAFLGWVLEVVYHVVCQGVVVNRGFLNGPVCPIYGFGMIFVLNLLSPVMGNLPMLFLGGMFLTTFIELIGGWALEKLFHMRWWDYSREPFNLNGYICPKFALAWGVGVVFAVRVLHTIVKSVSGFVLRTHLRWILIPFVILLVIDLAATVATIMKVQDDLKRLEHLAHEMREFSDALTEAIGTKTIETEQKIDESRVQAALGRAERKDAMVRHRHELEKEIQERKRRIEEIHKKLHGNRIFGRGRILAANPHMTHLSEKKKLKEFLDQKIYRV
ncbi:MAG: hypothetical protein MJ097_06250 [Dorea sp.]|nr:hypothetical protein [Dorea sp.]